MLFVFEKALRSVIVKMWKLYNAMHLHLVVHL